MKSKIKSQKGITLVALVITIIVLIILSGITIGKIAGNKGNINQTKNAVALSELSKVQQAVMETYVKYKQLNNSSLLIGTIIDNEEAQAMLTEVKPGESLKANDSDKIEYKYIKSLVENGKEFKDKDIEDKKRFLTKIEEMYYGKITSLNEKLVAIN